MTRNFDPDGAEVARLVHELEEGVITAEDRSLLMDRLRSDPSVREFYLEQTRLSTLIREVAQTRAELGTLPVSSETLQREKRRSALLSLGYAAAAVLVLGLGLLLYQVSQADGASGSGITLMGSADARFAVIHEGQGPGSEIRPGSQITLERGLIRLRFSSQVEALVEGPAQLELISESTLRMDGGTGWFRVPAGAEGFTVRTEYGQVVDLGTEFGVLFDGQGKLEVHLAQGRVRVIPARPETEPLELVEGRAIRLDSAGQSQDIDLAESRFRQEFSKEVPHLHWSFDYPIDGGFPAQGNFSDLGDLSLNPKNLDGSRRDPDDLLTPGIRGRALSLKGDGDFAESAFQGMPRDAPLTVAAWVRHRGRTWPPRPTDPRIGLGATTPFGQQAYLLHYTNSGLTTSQGATGQTLEAGVTYTLHFHKATLPGRSSAGYQVDLVAFDPTEDDASRRDQRPLRAPGVVLATARGEVASHNLSESESISFTPRVDHPHLGKEIGIRLVNVAGPSLYDRLRLTTRRGQGAETVVFTEDFETPVVTGYAQQTLPSRHWIGPDAAPDARETGFGSNRHGLFSQRPVFTTPWCGWGGRESGPRWSFFAVPDQAFCCSAIDGGGFLDAPTPIEPDRWTHVAFVSGGQTAESGSSETQWFVDGRRVGSRPWSVAVPFSGPDLDTAGLLIGILPGARPGEPTLDADIDELHILRAALNEKEISRLMDFHVVNFLREGEN